MKKAHAGWPQLKADVSHCAALSDVIADVPSITAVLPPVGRSNRAAANAYKLGNLCNERSGEPDNHH
jgi:hypothetical protein